MKPIQDWIASLPEGATNEKVREGFWYVRIPGTARSWIPVEIEVNERTVKFTSHVIIEPEERAEDFYKLLLRRNHSASDVTFSLDGREGVVCLVGRLRHDELSVDSIDDLIGKIVQETEQTFRSMLQIGFGSRLKKR